MYINLLTEKVHIPARVFWNKNNIKYYITLYYVLWTSGIDSYSQITFQGVIVLFSFYIQRNRLRCSNLFKRIQLAKQSWNLNPGLWFLRPGSFCYTMLPPMGQVHILELFIKNINYYHCRKYKISSYKIWNKDALNTIFLID